MDPKKIPIFLLGPVRMRLGADESDDEGCDGRIAKMTPEGIVALYTGWTLGDEAWGRDIIAAYKSLLEIEKGEM